MKILANSGLKTEYDVRRGKPSTSLALEELPDVFE